MDSAQFVLLIEFQINKLHAAFKELQTSNDSGLLNISRDGLNLSVSVNKVGEYKFWADPVSQTLVL